jgi:hypothetical protein
MKRVWITTNYFLSSPTMLVSMTFKKQLFNNRSKNIHASKISELFQESTSKDSVCPVNTYDCISERKTCQNVTLQVKAAKEEGVWFQ